MAMAKPSFVEVAETPNGSIGAFFPAQWMQTLSLLSPIGMLGLWVLQQWWESRKGTDKKIEEDLEQMKEAITAIKTMLGSDLDHKIERKIERAFEYYEKGRRNQ